MNMKPLCVASGLVSFLAVHTIEYSGLPLGQAVFVALPTALLATWCFWQTDWCEPTNKKMPLQSGNSSKGR